MTNTIKPVAFYFPQYHVIPENDAWWGNGFTDWVNVRRARPLFRGHYQPREPLNDNYYDLSKTDIIEWQVDLARAHGLYGFCHYHYWFDGNQLLETPTDHFLTARRLDFKFCLAWANETWSRRWDGQDYHILQLQTHKPCKELWGRHFDYLIKFWTDERAITINGKPIFVIYRPIKVLEIENMFDYWQTRARSYGLDGICFLAMKQAQFQNPPCLKYFDGIIQFQPFVAMYGANNNKKKWRRFVRRFLPHKVSKYADELYIDYKNRYGKVQFYDYDTVWAQIIKDSRNADDTVYPGAFIDWDNTARYGKRAKVFRGACPEKFEYWLHQLVQALDDRQDRENIIFINAWNEWAESTYLEPDKRHGFGYLEAIRNVLEAHGATEPARMVNRVLQP